MARWGAYETVREISQHPLGAVWIAHASGSVTDAADRYVIKTTESSWQLGDPEREAAETQLFVDAATEQKRLFDAGAKRLVKVHDVGREEAGAYAAYDFLPRSAQRFILGKVKLETRAIRAIVEGVVDGLIQLRELGGGRAHGDLKPSNVLLSGVASDQSVTPDQVFIGDIRGLATLKPQDATQDVRDLGRLVYQLVTHKPVRDSAAWAATMSEDWQRLGPDGLWWFDFCSRLVDAGMGKPVPTLDAIRDELNAYKPRASGGKGKLIGVIAASALVVLEGGAYLALRKTSTTPVHAPPPAPGEWTKVRKNYFPWLFVLSTQDMPEKLTADDPRSVIKARLKQAGVKEFVSAILGEEAPDNWTPDDGPSKAAKEIKEALDAWRAQSEAMGDKWAALGWKSGQQLATSSRALKKVLEAQTAAAAPTSAAPGEKPVPAAPVDERQLIDDAKDVFRTLSTQWAIWPSMLDVDRKYEAAKAASATIGTLEGVEQDAVLARRDAILASIVSPLGQDGVDQAGLTRVSEDIVKFGKLIADAKTLWGDQDWRKASFLEQNIAKNTNNNADLTLLAERNKSADDFLDKLVTTETDPRDAKRLAKWETDLASVSKALDLIVQKDLKDLSTEEQGDVQASVEDLKGLKSRIEALRDTKRARWVQRNLKDIKEGVVKVEADLVKLQSFAKATQDTISEGVAGLIKAADQLFAGPGAIGEMWRTRMNARRDALSKMTLSEVRNELSKDRKWIGDLDAKFGLRLTADQKAKLVAQLAEVEPLLQAESASRIDKTIRSLKFGDPLDAGAVQSAADGFDAWRTDAIEMIAQHARVEQLLNLAYLPTETGGDAAPLSTVVQKWNERKDLFAQPPALVSRVRGEIEALASLGAAKPEQLLATIADPKERVSRRWGSWRALVARTDWPMSPAQVVGARDAMKSAKAMLSGLSGARATELASLVDKDGRELWSGAAASAPNPADLGQVLAVSPDFGVTFAGGTWEQRIASWEKETADPALKNSPEARFNLLVALTLRDSGTLLAVKDPKDEAEQKRLVNELKGQLESAAKGLGVDAAAAGMIEQLAKAAGGEAPFDPAAPTAPLPASIVGSRLSATARVDEATGLVVYSFKGKSGTAYQLEFIPVDVQSPAGTQRVFMLTSEVSIGLVVDVLTAADAWKDVEGKEGVKGIMNWSKEAPRSMSTADGGVWGWQWDRTGVNKPREIKLAAIPPGEKNPKLWGNGWYRSDANLAAFLNPPELERGIFAAPEWYTSVQAPSLKMPMQQVPIAGAAFVAKLLGCRVPSSDEWAAARASGAQKDDWNLRDSWFKTQFDYVAQANAQKAGSFPYPAAGVATPADQVVDASKDGDAVTGGKDDGIVFFRATGNDSPAGAFRDLEGNVAEWVFENPKALDEVRPEGDQVKRLVDDLTKLMGPEADQVAKDSGGEKLRRIIGGSALSGSWWPDRSKTIVTKKIFERTAGFKGFADVGFRLAFTATGGTKSPVERAKEALQKEGFLAKK